MRKTNDHDPADRYNYPRVDNRQRVIDSWMLDQPARVRNMTLSTDGKRLYSYDLVIGITDNESYPASPKRVGDFTARGDFRCYKHANCRDKRHSWSITTSIHVSLARQTGGVASVPYEEVQQYEQR